MLHRDPRAVLDPTPVGDRYTLDRELGRGGMAVVRVRGWIDHVYFTRHDRFLESLRAVGRFQELMASARERYARFTDDGTPTRELMSP